MSDCPASVHKPTTWSYRRYGCRCPETVAVQRRSRATRQRHRRGSGRYWGGRPSRDSYMDEIAIERACSGDPAVLLTPPERQEAVRRLTGRGLGARQIAARLGVAQRTVVRWRSNLRQHDVSRETSRETSDPCRTAA